MVNVYVDMYFIIPETVDNVDFQKGPYNATRGNFTTAGFVEIKKKNGLCNILEKFEGNMFDTHHALGMFDLLTENQEQSNKPGMWLLNLLIPMVTSTN